MKMEFKPITNRTNHASQQKSIYDDMRDDEKQEEKR